ncbi:Uncharacterised protein [uncultured archaeon]|nr:Uncharacterised protein [uncultured archaeon]
MNYFKGQNIKELAEHLNSLDKKFLKIKLSRHTIMFDKKDGRPVSIFNPRIRYAAKHLTISKILLQSKPKLRGQNKQKAVQILEAARRAIKLAGLEEHIVPHEKGGFYLEHNMDSKANPKILQLYEHLRKQRGKEKHVVKRRIIK